MDEHTKSTAVRLLGVAAITICFFATEAATYAASEQSENMPEARGQSSAEGEASRTCNTLPPPLDPDVLTVPEVISVKDIPGCFPLYQQLTTLEGERERLEARIESYRLFKSDLLKSSSAGLDAVQFADYALEIDAEIESLRNSIDTIDSSLEALRHGVTADICLLLNRLRNLPRIVALQPSSSTDDGQLAMLALLKEIQPLLRKELTESQFALILTFLTEWKATVKLLQEVVANRCRDE